MEIPYHGFWVVKFAVVRLVHGSSVRLDDHARNPEHRGGRGDRRSPDRKGRKALDEVYNQCLSMEMERRRPHLVGGDVDLELGNKMPLFLPALPYQAT
jgi:hypothetical protein